MTNDRIHAGRWIAVVLFALLLFVEATTFPLLALVRSEHDSCVRGNVLRTNIVTYVEALAVPEQSKSTPSQRAQFESQLHEHFAPKGC